MCKMELQRELGLPINAETPLLAFVGRLDYQKGPDLILEALPRLVNMGPGCQVGICSCRCRCLYVG